MGNTFRQKVKKSCLPSSRVPGTSHLSSELTWPRSAHGSHPQPPVSLQKEAVGTSATRNAKQAS